MVVDLTVILIVLRSFAVAVQVSVFFASATSHRRFASGAAETPSHLSLPSELRGASGLFSVQRPPSLPRSRVRLYGSIMLPIGLPELLRLLVPAAKDLTFPTVVSMLVKG